MAGWGVKLLGFSNLMDAFGDIQTRLSDDAVYVVGTNVEYAVYVELGTSRMSAKPFLFPSARNAERNPLAYIRRHTDVSIVDIESTEDLVRTLALAIERDASERAPVDTGNLMNSIRAEKVR